MAPADQQSAEDLDLPNHWNIGEDGKVIETRVRTKDFMTAVGLMQEIAQVAEDENHHPDLHLVGYNHLRIASFSHDVGKLTDRDARLAKRIETILRDKDVKRE